MWVTGLRLFLAVDLPQDAIDILTNLQNRLKTGCRFVDAHPRWVDVSNLHLTLIFLGETSEERAASLDSLVESVVTQVEVFELELARPGLFPPDSKKPKVLSVDVKSTGKSLRNLYNDLHRSLTVAGYPVEERPYKPHLTLARLPSIKSAARFGPLVESHAKMLNFKFPVRDIVLFESILGPEGPSYNALKRYSFSAEPVV